MKNFINLLLISGLFVSTFLLSSCTGNDYNKLILGKFEGDLNDEEMDIKISYYFNKDMSLLAKATIKPKSEEAEGMEINVDIKGTYSINEGYLFMKYESLTSEPAEFKEALEKEFIGEEMQNKILELNDEQLVLEEEKKEKWTLKRIKD